MAVGKRARSGLHTGLYHREVWPEGWPSRHGTAVISNFSWCLFPFLPFISFCPFLWSHFFGSISLAAHFHFSSTSPSISYRRHFPLLPNGCCLPFLCPRVSICGCMCPHPQKLQSNRSAAHRSPEVTPPIGALCSSPTGRTTQRRSRIRVRYMEGETQLPTDTGHFPPRAPPKPESYT